jgi:hypothetical protein
MKENTKKKEKKKWLGKCGLDVKVYLELGASTGPKHTCKLPSSVD